MTSWDDEEAVCDWCGSSMIDAECDDYCTQECLDAACGGDPI